MPIFASFLLNLAGAFLAFFTRRIAARYAYTLATFAAIAVAYGVLRGVFSAITAGLTLVMPDALQIAFSWVAPDNINTCLAVRCTIEVAVATYRWVYNIQLAAAVQS